MVAGIPKKKEEITEDNITSGYEKWACDIILDFPHEENGRLPVQNLNWNISTTGPNMKILLSVYSVQFNPPLFNNTMIIPWELNLSFHLNYVTIN